MWEAIQYVSTGLTLVAFLAAVGAWVYKARVDAREKLIATANADQRTELVARTLEYFDVDTSGLTKDQKYDLALTQIHARSQRYQQTAVVVCFIALVLALLAGFAISRGNTPTPAQSPASDATGPDRAGSASPTASTPTVATVQPTQTPAPAPIPLTADSGWRGGGSSIDPYCNEQKGKYEKQYPGRVVDVVDKREDHKSEYTPFKHDYYRYQCWFVVR
jgi:hypothetical protein